MCIFWEGSPAYTCFWLESHSVISCDKYDNIFSHSYCLLPAQSVKMDKFGYIRGRRGPPGPPGRDAIDTFTWTPYSVLRMFRENEECTFYFNTADDGILYDKDEKPVGLKDRYEGLKWKSRVKNALCLQNFQTPVKLNSGYYGIFLKNSLYKVSDVTIASATPFIMVVAFSFKADATLTDEDDYIFTNENSSRGITISRNSLNILGSQARLDLEYKYNDWNTMIIQYSNITPLIEDECIFILNKKRRGYFKLRYDDKEEKDIFIGGHPQEQNFGDFGVVLANFEIYGKMFKEKHSSGYILPDEIIDVLQKDMDERVY